MPLCTVLDCPSGTYGVECTSQCECTEGTRCRPTDGKCLCPAGRTGSKCDQGNISVQCSYWICFDSGYNNICVCTQSCVTVVCAL